MKKITPEELELISKWNYRDFLGLIEFIKAFWWMPDQAIKIENNRDHYIVTLSTLSWKGNQEIIHAMMDNIIFWNKYWKKTEVGGHHTFRYKKLIY